MPSPGKQPSGRPRRASSKEPDDEAIASAAATTATTETVPPSRHLYVGNLSLDTSETELAALFSKYGALDRVTSYPSRNYAFVYFKHVDDAKVAKETLQGALVRGYSIKIQFAKPAKASKHLWIGSLSPAVTRKQLDDEFSKFGEIEELKLLKDRNSAFVDYCKIEDAADAMKKMDGKLLCGERIRVDYVRSQPLRRDWTDYYDRWMPMESFRNFPGTSQPGRRRPLSNEGQTEGQLSKVLCIRYPPSVPIDEQLLHNALILFGEIERIRTFPGRHYSLVEFRSVDEAWRAKEGLQGRLFNDPRIQIMFSYGDIAFSQDGSPFFTGNRGLQADTFFSEPPFGPGEVFAPSGLMSSNKFSGHFPSNMMRGPNVHRRPFAQAFDSNHGGPEYGEIGGFADGSSVPWRTGSPSAPGILPSPGMRPSVRASQGAWDEFDGREPKRSRFDGTSFVDDVPFQARRLGSQEPYGLPQPDRDPFGRVLPSPIRINGTPANIPKRNDSQVVHSVHCWCGLIAKGGTPVCHARCIPIGNGIDSTIPEVVNCSARTGLDMLAKHYAEASGFDIVFFLPDSEDDFASYTEFLHYLGAKNRAGVAKFEDGTTLFLVPPSDFLSKTLNVSGPERLYGIVLKLPQQSVAVTVQHPQAITPTLQYADRQQLIPLAGYNLVPRNEKQPRPEYGRIPCDSSEACAAGGLLVAHSGESNATTPLSLGYISNATATPQVGVSLPQDLLASLVSLVPSGVQSLANGKVQLPLNSSTRPVVSSSVSDKVVAPQVWKQAHQEQLHQSSQVGYQVSNQSHVSNQPLQVQFSNDGDTGNTLDYSMQAVPGGIHAQDPAVNVQNVNNLHASLPDSYAYVSQGGTSAPLASQQQYPIDTSYGFHKSYAMTPTTDISGGYNSSVQSVPPSISSTQDKSGQMFQPQSMPPLAIDKGKSELPTQLHAALLNSSQNTTTSESDKNQRYQSTLQFAASLLLQIQQQQQKQGNVQPMQGSGNQQ